MKAMALLANYYGTVRQSRKSEQKREMFMKRLDIDSELCSCKYNSYHTPEVTIWCLSFGVQLVPLNTWHGCSDSITMEHVL